MTKKDYVLIAKVLNDILQWDVNTFAGVPKEHQREAWMSAIVGALSDEFYKNNNAFDEDRFRVAVWGKGVLS